jgi:hypothetical protein
MAVEKSKKASTALLVLSILFSPLLWLIDATCMSLYWVVPRFARPPVPRPVKLDANDPVGSVQQHAGYGPPGRPHTEMAATSRIDPYVIVAVVGAFLLGGTVMFAVMKTVRPTIDDCIFEMMRGQPQTMTGYAIKVCRARHPGEWPNTPGW